MRKLHLLKYCVIGFILLLISQIAAAQDGYKGIIPIKSTCQDVINILGGECGVSEQTFNLPNERVLIDFSTQKCQEAYEKKWNVPVGTVLKITRYFKDPPTLEEAGITITESDYNKSYTDVISQTIYEKKHGGLIVYTTNGYVNSLHYIPTDEDNSKVCKSKKKSKISNKN